MEYLVSDIIRAAKVAIDENVSSDALTALGDLDTLTLDEIIRSKVEDAARLVEEGAAHYLLDAGQAFGGAIYWDSEVAGYGAGRVSLPDDFMRLVSFEMSDWSYPVTVAITEEDPRYPMQSSRYRGVRGNPQRPVVAITHGATGLQLEFYSCEAGPDVHIKLAHYLAVPKVSTAGKIDLCPKLERAVVYRLASMTAAIVGAPDLAATLLGTSNELAGIVTG